jgi:hypothetical protein
MTFRKLGPCPFSGGNTAIQLDPAERTNTVTANKLRQCLHISVPVQISETLYSLRNSEGKRSKKINSSKPLCLSGIFVQVNVVLLS